MGRAQAGAVKIVTRAGCAVTTPSLVAFSRKKAAKTAFTTPPKPACHIDSPVKFIYRLSIVRK
jgi:hypothetical protein